jgi:hypothetical protein
LCVHANMCEYMHPRLRGGCMEARIVVEGTCSCLWCLCRYMYVQTYMRNSLHPRLWPMCKLSVNLNTCCTYITQWLGQLCTRATHKRQLTTVVSIRRKQWRVLVLMQQCMCTSQRVCACMHAHLPGSRRWRWPSTRTILACHNAIVRSSHACRRMYACTRPSKHIGHARHLLDTRCHG